MKTKKFIIWYIIGLLIILFSIFLYIIYDCKTSIAVLETKLHTAKQKTKIQLIKDSLYDNKNTIIARKEAKEQAQKQYNSSIWYGRCLETLWELELKFIDHGLQCDSNNYKELEKFAIYSLHKTRQELGL